MKIFPGLLQAKLIFSILTSNSVKMEGSMDIESLTIQESSTSSDYCLALEEVVDDLLELQSEMASLYEKMEKLREKLQDKIDCENKK